MSYWSHNPERYDEIIRRGIHQWIRSLLDKAGFSIPDYEVSDFGAFIEVLQTEPSVHHLYEVFMNLASKEISHAEQDYWGGLIDQAKERITE